MARGHPDYKGSNSIYGQNMTDVAELAARLGSTNVLERRGSVLWADDMGNLLNDYEVIEQGTGTVKPVLSIGYQYACVFQATPDDAIDPSCELSKRVPFIRLNKIGVEVMFALEFTALMLLTDPIIKLTYFDGVTAWAFQVDIKPNGHTLNLFTGVPYPGTDTIFYTAPFDFWKSGAINLYNYFKLVIDLENKRFDRFVFNNFGGNLQAYPCSQVANPSAPHIELILGTLPNVDNQRIFWANPIITMDEP